MNAVLQGSVDRVSVRINQVLKEAAADLEELPGASPLLEASILLGQVIGKPLAYLRAWPDRELSMPVLKAFREVLGRRAAGEPIAYILGRREFWSLDLKVTRDTLIPRPETERLVELTLERMPDGESCRVVDLGTGCGAIAAALASERPGARIVATDISLAALKVAQENFQILGLQAIETRLGCWFDTLEAESPFEIVCANPPYVAGNDPHLRIGDLRYEPLRALVAGDEGLDAIAEITRECPGFLTKGGWLLLEHGEEQGQSVRRLFREAGLSEVMTYPDLAGRERVTQGQRP